MCTIRRTNTHLFFPSVVLRFVFIHPCHVLSQPHFSKEKLTAEEEEIRGAEKKKILIPVCFTRDLFLHCQLVWRQIPLTAHTLSEPSPQKASPSLHFTFFLTKSSPPLNRYGTTQHTLFLVLLFSLHVVVVYVCVLRGWACFVRC